MDTLSMATDNPDPATVDWALEDDAAVLAAARAGVQRAQAELERRAG